MNENLITVGEYSFNLAELLIGAAVLFLCLMLWMALSLRRLKMQGVKEEGSLYEQTRDLEAQLQTMNQLHADLKGRLSTVAEVFGQSQMDLNKSLMERFEALQFRLGQGLEKQTQTTNATLSQLGERLAVIDGAQNNIKSLAQEMTSLKDILSNKQSRGAFGQAHLEALLRDGLPMGTYTFQATLGNGKRPDALIHLPCDERPLVIDAKFPLESFAAFREANTDATRKSAAQGVRTDLNKHVQDIAERYLLPGGTQDLALMFIPSEGLYADLYEHFEDVLQKAYRSKVVIVSPSLLMLSIQMMRSQIRDARMREQVHVLQSEIGELVKDVGRLGERARKLETHFAQAQDDLSGVVTSAEKITRRGGRIEDMDFIADGNSAADGQTKPALKSIQ